MRVRHSFADVSALTPTGSGGYAAHVHPEWTIGGKPNGGYLLGMMARAAVDVGAHSDVIAASAHYLRSPEPGPVVVRAELLRQGRSTSQVRASMLQDDQTCVEALITVSEIRDTAAYWDKGMPFPGDARWEDCVQLIADTPMGIRVAIMDQVIVRVDPETAGFTVGQPTGRGELRGWLALPEDHDFDPCSLLFALDSFPPATFDIEFAGWVPTLELTCYVRALPAPGPVRVVQRATVVADRRVDEACFVWDSTGRLVAQGTQLAGIRLGA